MSLQVVHGILEVDPKFRLSGAAKALELFLQNLCDKTYEITLGRGAKTMSSIHL